MARPPGTRKLKLHPTTDALPSTLPLMSRENFEVARLLFFDRDYLVSLQKDLDRLGPQAPGLKLDCRLVTAPLNREIINTGINYCLDRIDSEIRRLGVCPILTPTDDDADPTPAAHSLPLGDGATPALLGSDGGADGGATTADPSAPDPSWEGSDQPSADPGAGDANAAATTDPAAATTDPGPVAA